MQRPPLTTLALLAAFGSSSLIACGMSDMSADMGSPTGGAYYNGPQEQADAPSNEGDRYEAVGTNPFVMTDHDPLSTFAADVDTASYDIFRRDIGLGTLPQPESVRLEEYVNSFDYPTDAPPAPSDPDPFALHLEAAPSPFNDTTLLRVGLQGTPREATVKKPANLVFLIDVSGSMASGTKLGLVQHLLSATVDHLDPETDRVAIVTYAGNTAVRLPSTPVAERDTILGVLGSLQAGGSTNGAGGIQLAYEQAEAHFIPEGINHVILCTDGDFNVGTSSTQALVDLITEKRISGVTLTALGFGSGNLNDAMMERVSNAGNGIYGVISSQTHADTYVQDDLLASLQHIAKDIKIQVEFNPDRVLAYRLLGYENRAIADDDFRNDLVDAGEIGAGHHVTALYELVLTDGIVPERADAPAVESGASFDGLLEVGEDELARIKLRYKYPDATAESEAIEFSAGLTPDAIAADLSAASSDLQWAAAIAAFAEILKESPYAPGAEHLETIDALTHNNAADAADRAEFRQLFSGARALIQR